MNRLLSYITPFRTYSRVLLFAYALLLLFRLAEYMAIMVLHITESSLVPELAGLVTDLLLVNVIFLIGFPLYLVIRSTWLRLLLFWLFIFLFLLHVPILGYFLYQLEPLNAFIFKYSFAEMWLTVNTTDIRVWPVYICIVAVIILGSIFLFIKKRIVVSDTLFKGLAIFVIVSPLAFILSGRAIAESESGHIAVNKSYYFYKNTFAYFLEDRQGEYDAELIREFKKYFDREDWIDENYPLLHKLKSEDVFSPLLKAYKTKPNIVIVIVEGLSEDFMHPFHGVQFMPFLDSLSKQSLYWNRCLTLGERSYAVVPSLLGSLPYGEMGFTLLNQYPYHHSLVNVLGQNGYFTSFYYGQGSWFHNKRDFFRFNDIDQIVDNERFYPKHHKIIVGEDQFFWGYHDKDLFARSHDTMSYIRKKKRLNIYFTGTTHTPYEISNKVYYNALLDRLMQENGVGAADKAFFAKYRKYCLSLLFVNDALQELFATFKKRLDYKNTLFIITGDHPMSEIPPTNPLKKYHVPLLLFSHLIIEPQLYSGVTSHLDIYEPLLVWLRNTYGLSIPAHSTALGHTLPCTQKYDNSGTYAFMNGNRDIIDLYSDGYFLSNENILYKADDKFNLTRVSNAQQFDKMHEALKAFRHVNYYTTLQDKLMPDSIYFKDRGAVVYASASKPGKHTTTDEYNDLFQPMPIDTGYCFFDYSLSFRCAAKDKPVMVFKLLDERKQVLLTETTHFPEDKEQVQVHLKKKNLPKGCRQLYVQAFIHNPARVSYTISNLKAAVYKH